MLLSIFCTGLKCMTHRNDQGRKSKWVTLSSTFGSSDRCAPEAQPSQSHLLQLGLHWKGDFFWRRWDSQKRSESGIVRNIRASGSYPVSFPKSIFCYQLRGFLSTFHHFQLPGIPPLLANHSLSAVHTSKSCLPWYSPPHSSKLEVVRFVYLSNR